MIDNIVFSSCHIGVCQMSQRRKATKIIAYWIKQ